MPTPPECAELELYNEPEAETGSPSLLSISTKFRAEYDDVVETDPFCVVLAPKLFVLLCADSSLLPPLADKPGAICRGGSLRLL